MTAVLEFIDAAAVVLAEHATYTWNKSATRIRCDGDRCGTVLEAPAGAEEAVLVFARHQAEKIPEPVEDPVAPVLVDTPAVLSPEPAEPELAPAEIRDNLEPAPEPSGEPMETADPATAPKVRRDTKALTATIAEVKKGDRVTAGFNHPRYGRFTVLGTVVKGGTGLDRNQLIVGGWYLNLNERAAKYLCDLNILEAAGNHGFDIPKPSDLTEHVGIGS